MMWLLLRISSFVWFVYLLLFLSLYGGLSSENESIQNFKIIAVVMIILMAVLTFMFYYVSVKEKQRKTAKKLRPALNKYFRRLEFSLPLQKFAEDNGVKIREAQKFIDNLIEHYENKLDISEEGMIYYLPMFKPRPKTKKQFRKKKR